MCQPLIQHTIEGECRWTWNWDWAMGLLLNVRQWYMGNGEKGKLGKGPCCRCSFAHSLSQSFLPVCAVDLSASSLLYFSSSSSAPFLLSISAPSSCAILHAHSLICKCSLTSVSLLSFCDPSTTILESASLFELWSLCDVFASLPCFCPRCSCLNAALHSPLLCMSLQPVSSIDDGQLNELSAFMLVMFRREQRANLLRGGSQFLLASATRYNPSTATDNHYSCLSLMWSVARTMTCSLSLRCSHPGRPRRRFSLCGSLTLPLPRIRIRQSVSASSCLTVIPHGPRILPM